MTEYIDLPFRVIVHRILPYFCLAVENEDYGEYVLYGYFKSDPTRKLFQIFSSYSIRNIPFYSNIDQTIYFRTSRVPEKILPKLIKDSAKFRCLESLMIYIPRDSPSNVVNPKSWFSTQNCFPNLTRLSVVLPSEVEESGRDLSSWLSASHMWKNIQKFLITSHETENDYFLPLFEHEGFGKNLRRLSFSILQFFKEGVTKRKKIELPNLRILEHLTGGNDDTSRLGGFPLEYFSTTENLKLVNFSFHISTIEKHKEFILRCPNIEHVHCRNDINCDLSFLFQLPLKRLDIYRFSETVSNPNWEKWEPKKNEKFLNNVQSIELSKLSNIKQLFRGVDLPNLKSLILKDSQIEEEEHESLSTELVLSPKTCGLERLEFVCVGDLNDFFFQIHNFPNLTYLRCYGYNNLMIGKNWNPLPKIKKIKFHNLNMDRIFQDLEMPNLEKLDLINCEMTGKGWKKCNTQNLRKFRIKFSEYYKVNVSPEIFVEEDRFLRLEKLDLENVVFSEKCWGEWKVGTLIDLSLENCNCTDELFQGKFKWTNNLRSLDITNCDFLEGNDWEFMPDLRYLEIDECGKIDVQNFKKNLTCVDEKCELVFFSDDESSENESTSESVSV